MSLNKAMLIGNVGKDPEVRYLGDGGNSKVARFTLATSEKYKDRDGNTRENTVWHTITAWRAAADYVEKYVKKGMQLYVEGPLRYNTWNDKSGNPRNSCEIVAENMQILGKKSDNRQSDGEGNRPASVEGNRQERQVPVPPKPAISPDDNDDIPF